MIRIFPDEGFFTRINYVALKNILIAFILFMTMSAPGQESIDSVQLNIGDSLYNQAGIIYETNPDSAAVLIEKTLGFYEKSAAWGEYVNRINVLTTVYFYLERLDAYQSFANLAHRVAQRKLPANHPEYAVALNNLYSSYYSMGDYENAIKLLKKSLEIKRNNQANKLELAFAYNNIGSVQTEKGDYVEALEYLFRGLDLRQDTFQKNPISSLGKLLTNSKLNIAWAYFKDDQKDLALDYYNSISQDLEKFKKDFSVSSKRDIINVLQSSAKIYYSNEEYATAEDRLLAALQYQKEDQAFRKSYSHELLGKIYLTRGRYAAAIEENQEAIRLAKKYYAKTRLIDYSRKIKGLAEVKAAQGEYREALEYYQKALQILAPGFVSNEFRDNPVLDSIYSKEKALALFSGKGELFWKEYGKTQNADLLRYSFETFKAGVSMIQDIRRGVVSMEAKTTLSEKTIPIYAGAIRASLVLYETTQDANWLEQAFTLAESNKSLLLLESVNEQAALGIQGLPDSLLQKDKELRLNIAFYKKQLIEAQSKKETASTLRIKEWKKQLFDLKGELQALTDHFEAAYPRFYQLKYQNETPILSAWQAQLASNEQALIEYFVGENRIYGFVLWKDGLRYFEIENKDTVFAAIGQLRSSISELPTDAEVLQNHQNFTNSAHQLYQALLAPALAELPAEITSLKIIPDDQLNYIPFDVLLMESAKGDQPVFPLNHLAYVLEKYSVSYDYSATWMLKNEAHKNLQYQQDFIAYAPSFKKAAIADGTRALRACQESELYDLECSHEEVREINALMNGETRISEAALKSTFAQEAGKYRIIHMATHACADEANPLFNKIFLSDDYLSNADLYNTELNAELVVLSACNTGSGKLVKGEGVLSLARGFVQAGCASSVVSRWSVDDCTTSEIMYRFYEALRGGESKDGALRQAKLDYLTNTDQLYGHPYFWSAFVAYGEMDTMDLGNNKYGYLYGLLGLLLLGLLLFYRQRRTAA